MTWFQAQAFARNSHKRLPTNEEWQAAALGTVDLGASPGSADCNTNSSVSLTGSRANCVSDVGAFDMVGNLSEWVADWVPPANSCTASLFLTNDTNCMAVDPAFPLVVSGPAALIRGGNSILSSGGGADAGVFAVRAVDTPSLSFNFVGFRAAR